MTVKTKIRLLDLLRHVAPEWALRRQAAVIEHAFDKDLTKAKTQDERQEILHQRDWEAREYANALSEVRSHKLVRRARRLYVPLNDLTWVNDEYANHYLDWDSQTKLRRAVVEESRKAWEFRLKIFVGVTQVLVGLTGLVGSLIGLIAVLRKH